MSIDDHPLYEQWNNAFRKLQAAHDHLRSELKKGDRGLVDAAKLDLDKAQEAYNAISAQL